MDSFNYSVATLERAKAVYDLLAARVRGGNLDSITYGQVARQLGFHHRALRPPLAKIQDECRAKVWPTITVLIVDQATMMPNEGCDAYESSEVAKVRAEVATVPWPERAWW